MLEVGNFPLLLFLIVQKHNALKRLSQDSLSLLPRKKKMGQGEYFYLHIVQMMVPHKSTSFRMFCVVCSFVVTIIEL